MSVLMNVVSIWRSRSGLAWASCSCRKRAGSILLGAVIAFFSWVSVEGHPEDHAVAAFTSGPHSGWGPSYTTLADATLVIRRSTRCSVAARISAVIVLSSLGYRMQGVRRRVGAA